LQVRIYWAALLFLACTAVGSAVKPDEFQTPEKRFRPWVIWWWFGNSSSAEHLAWELAEMDRAGIGGAQIFPIYPLSEDRPNDGIQAVRLFSPAWQAQFASALREANARNMKLLLAGGSGWPLGGPWIEKAQSSRGLARAVMNLRGPVRVDIPWPKPDIHTHWEMDAVEAVVAMDRGLKRTVVPVTTGDRFVWNAPPGEWRIHFIYRMFTNQQLERGGLTDTGLVLDHFSKDALNVQLSKLQSALPTIRENGSAGFVGFTADSLELEDSNWTPGFLSEFRQRRGYDLAPFLPDLWEWSSPYSGAVRQDFLQTVSDLKIDNYFRHYADWAKRAGFGTSVQAHGTIADVLQAYGQLDLPDVETMWPGSEHQEVNLRSRRIGVSASHIYGKPIVAAESFTWLSVPRFTATLEQMKAAADALFIDGVNRIKAHGYSSSPPAAGKPGWVYYASTLVNHNQTWWPHFPKLAKYISRVSYLMQSGQYQADVLLYHDLPDARAHYNRPRPEWQKDYVWRHRERDPGLDSAAMIAEWIKQSADALQRAGYGFDVVNDDALLNQMQIKGGFFEAHGIRYKALVFHEAESIPLATLQRAEEFAKAGGLVIAVGRIPVQGVGLVEQRDKKAEVKALIDRIWKTGSGRFARDSDELKTVLDQRIQPDFLVDPKVGAIHRRDGQRDIYFLANNSTHAIGTTVSLRVQSAIVEKWYAMTGKIVRARNVRIVNGRTLVPVTLGPKESVALITSSGSAAKEESTPVTFKNEVPLDGLWTLEVPNLPPQNRPLGDWSAEQATSGFSGIATYRKEFDLPSGWQVGKPILLSLGQLHSSAEVFCNGKSAGILIQGPWQAELSDCVKAGRNTLEIRVANLWNNHVMDMPYSRSKLPAPGYGLTEALYGPRQRQRLPSGLLGPVSIKQ
jgi:hypothetical protein